MKRVFVLGPPGCERKDYAKRLKDQFNMQLIETSDLLTKEAEQNTPEAKQIQAAFKEGSYGKLFLLPFFSFCFSQYPTKS